MEASCASQLILRHPLSNKPTILQQAARKHTHHGPGQCEGGHFPLVLRVQVLMIREETIVKVLVEGLGIGPRRKWKLGWNQNRGSL